MLLDEFPFYLIDFLTILYIRNLGCLCVSVEIVDTKNNNVILFN